MTAYIRFYMANNNHKHIMSYYNIILNVDHSPFFQVIYEWGPDSLFKF